MAVQFAYRLLQLEWTTSNAWAGLIVLLGSGIYLVVHIWRSYKLHTFYRRQKIKGPEYRPLVGNWVDIGNLQRQFARIRRQSVHPADVAIRSLPHLSHWSKLYGSVFTYMEGARVNLCVLDPGIIRELLVSKADCYRRSPAGGLIWRNLGGSVRRGPDQDQSKIAELMSHCEPHRWSTLRRILGPGTDHDCNTVQGNLQNTIDQCKTVMSRWGFLLDETCDVGDGRVEVDATHDIAKTSMRIVLTNLIGSTLSSNNLEMIDSMLDTKKEEGENATVTCDLFSGHFGCSSSSKDNWLNKLLTETVQSRFGNMERQTGKDPRDLLHLMVSSSYRRGAKKDVQQLVADCKMMVAAQNSTTVLINQTLLLLARHTHWQLQARAEVLDIRPLCSAFAVDEDGENCNMIYPKLAKLKVLNMILNESLRLSPPIISIEKLCQKRHRLGKYTVLPGTYVQMPIVLLHHSPELWGADSSSFRPDRFEHGKGRPRPFALLPFSAGPSGCLGFNFALQEAKIVLASILSNFSFRLSSDYLANGADSLLQPGGAPPLLSIKRLMLDDFALAAKERLSRTRSNFF